MLSSVISFLVKTILILIIPFFILIRSAVHLHNASDLLPWVCISGGVLMAMLIVGVYLTFFHRLFVSGSGILSLKARAILSMIIVMTYVIHGLFYLSTANMKSVKLKKEILTVHPVLRLATSTLIHVDKSLVITDADRTPEDYKKMGLKSIKHSLHYKQYTGYAHALDLRTKGKPEWQNFLIRNYFRIMGFRTLRHIGTDDHLHVSLMSHRYPNAK